MNKAFLISASTALALGYGAGFASSGFEAKAAIDSSRDFSYEVRYAPAALKQCIRNALVVDNICPLMNAELGLSGSKVCNIKDLVSASLYPVMTETGREFIVNAQMRRKATLVLADPE